MTVTLHDRVVTACAEEPDAQGRFAIEFTITSGPLKGYTKTIRAPHRLLRYLQIGSIGVVAATIFDPPKK